MIRQMRTISRALLLATIMACLTAGAVSASPARVVRLGYLDSPGSALCRIAADQGHFRTEGLQVELVRFADSPKGLAALASGAIDVGAFAAGDSLRAIAAGKELRIIAGGGTPLPGKPLAELDESLQAENDSRGIVVLLSPTWQDAEKGTAIRLVTALIRAHLANQKQPQPYVHFDPNPDYWRLERLWRSLGLQAAAMKRDFLADHVYEEIYCDALDRLRSGAIDPILQQLFDSAVCTPDCCPADADAD